LPTTRFFILLSCAICITFATGCDRTPHKTDYDLRLEEAHRQVEILVNKGNSLLNAKVLTAPIQHLDSIVFAKNISHDAVQVFDKKNILVWQHDELTLLRNTILDLQPELAMHAIDLLTETTQKTIALRVRIEEVKNQPYGVKGVDAGKMVEYLSKEFNADILECCLVDLSRISELLALSPEQYQNIINLIRYIHRELEEVVRSKDAGKGLLSRIEKMRPS